MSTDHPQPAPRGRTARALSAALAAALAGALLPAAPLHAEAKVSAAASEPCAPAPDAPAKHQMRAMWISSVANIDWPSSQGLDAQAHRAELTAFYDEAVDLGLNAVFVQIRPTADALWPSPHEPWSEWLTGTQGADPGYDPLEFAVAEAHARNLEFHGWFNPYRVATHNDPGRLVPDHPARRNPDWVMEYGGRLYYDPGVPQVRAFVQEAMMHAVENYDMDGVHFDDYFYPYPVAGEEIPDADTYAAHRAGFTDIGDWRRNNVNLLVQEMGSRIRAAKPHVRFGVSPFGIWRNAGSHPEGSDTRGLQSYDSVYADSRAWVRQGWVDYVAPQVYWEIGLPVADYAVLVPWWSETVEGTGVHLYIGQAAYKAGGSGAWEDPAELSRHLTLNRDHPQVRGDIFFSAVRLRTNAAEAMRRVAEDHYSHPALVPAQEGRGGGAPAAPVITEAARTGSGVELGIRARGGGPAYYAVYRFDGPPGPDQPRCGIEDPRNMVATVRADGQTARFVDESAPEGGSTYYVTALDRRHHESAASEPRHVR